MTKNWVETTGRAKELPEEQQAYERMQNALVACNLTDAEIASDGFLRRDPATKAILTAEQEAGIPFDLTSLQGRRMRSHKNLEYMHEANADCPNALLGELMERIDNKHCTLLFEYSHDTKLEHIIQDGNLLSNAALLKRDSKISGGTSTCVVDDDKSFGNTDFVFTHPLFNDAGAPIDHIRTRFYVPGDRLLSNEYAWPSFRDWSDARDLYLGNKTFGDDVPDSQKSHVCDFFMGGDIQEAIALKTFEAIKTAIFLHPGNESPEGFDTVAASEFLTRIKNIRFPAYYGNLSNYNKLGVPLASLELTDKQKAFLLKRSPERNALIQEAVDATLNSMRDLAEVKVPRFISLDGAASVTHEYPNGNDADPVMVVTELSNETPTAKLEFTTNRQIEYRHQQVPADTRQYAASTREAQL